MSVNSGEGDLDDPAFKEVASSGAAADSAGAEKKIAGLPRLLRYALLRINDGVLIEQRLTAEIEALCPGLALNTAWAKDWRPELAFALAAELDHRAVASDKPELRALADSVRLLTLPAPADASHLEDHRRVAKALLLAQRAVSSEIDLELAAEIESFCWGWAALPAAIDFLSRYELASAAASSLVIGRRMAEYRVAAAEEAIEERYLDEKTGEKAGSLQNPRQGSDPASMPADYLMVCRLDETLLKAARTREIYAPFKAVINTPVPLRPTPPLQDVRAALMREFPYAENVIDFALTDLVGRTTVRLRPLLLVGDPGGGKTRFGRRLGEILGVHVWHTDASRADGAVFGGTDKRWHTAEPCHPMLAIARGGHANPLILIAELEKSGTRADFGRLWDCLLGFLELESARVYPDPVFQVAVDLSQISYVATVNALGNIPSPLLDRFRIANFPKPAVGDLFSLLPVVVADLAAERGLDARWIAPFDALEQAVIIKHWNGGSMRRLRRILEAMMQERDKFAAKN